MKLQRYGNSLLKHFLHAAKITFYFLSFSLEILLQPCRKILQTMSNHKKKPNPLGLLRLLFSIPCKCAPPNWGSSDTSTAASPSLYQCPRCDGQLRDRRRNDKTLKGLSKPRTALVFWSVSRILFGERGHVSELSDRTSQVLTNCAF